MRRLSIVVAASVLVACSEDSFVVGSVEDARADTKTAAETALVDSTTPSDTSVVDTAVDTHQEDTSKPETAGQCVLASDCKKFSSYCATNPCMCLALKATDPEPTCPGPSVTCFADPCESKSAECVGGVCVIK